MSMQERYEEHVRKRQALEKHPMAHAWVNQERRYMKPFQIYGNLYYVGDTWVSAHIVDTGEGLLLFDSGNYGATAMLIQAIWEMGFNPADVKWLVLSHGHVDHIGSANFFKEMFGTKLYLGAPDAEMFRSRPWLSLLQESPNYEDTLFVPDVEIQDGDVITFGNTTVQFYITPGHTEGCISCFFDVTDGVTPKRVGYFGGFGFNTLQKSFLLEIGDTSYDMRNQYLASLDKVRDEKVEIFMSNHPNNVDLLKKREYMMAHPEENPFIDDTAWGIYLDGKRKDLLKFIEDPKNS